MSLSCRRVFAFVVLAAVVAGGGLFASFSFAADWYVAPDGVDTNSGSSNAPFASLMRAQATATADDTVFLRGGTYFLNNSHLTATNSPWAIVNRINKSGIRYRAVPGERPVFDFTDVKPPGWRVTAFLVTASDCVFEGFDVVGVQVTIQAGEASNTQSECFRVAGGNRNRFERLVMRDGMGVGWYLTSGQSNLVLNCDAYNNRGLDSLSIGNVDGFGAHPSSVNGTGNVFRGCRAWFNSDDGFDLINADALVVIENCWAFYNGYFTNFASSGGDGHGFKSGGYGRNGSAFPTPVPRHVTRFSVAVRNRVSGFYANHHTGGLDFLHNTAYQNNVNYNMLGTLADNLTDVPGYDHLLKNNLGFRARSGTEVSNLGGADTNDLSFNYFNLPVTAATNDFLSLDESLLMAPRQPNGDLPYTALLQLVSGSDLRDVGTNVGFGFVGSAPDLGAFEYGSYPAPTLALNHQNGNLVFTGSGGPAGGTNYLIATTNVSLPQSEWSRVATNQFNLLGQVTLTNESASSPRQFYRLELP
jgi:hypothetical protein